jgi:CRISPR/Cas system CSM-associated protein Csm4 (group 5 of RAMP superfamily)
VVSFVDTSTAEITMSTMSTDERMIVPKYQSNLTQLKYESTIQQMQKTNIAQMNEIITKQKEHESKIEQLQNSQIKIKENLEMKMDNKIEQQTNLLMSLVLMKIHDMKEDKLSKIRP